MPDFDKYFEEHIQTKRIDKETWAVIEFCKQYYRLDPSNRESWINKFNSHPCNAEEYEYSALEMEIYAIFKRENILLEENSGLLSCGAMYDNNTKTFTEDFLDVYLEYVCERVYWDVNSYKFIYYISSFITKFYKNIHESHLENLYHNHIDIRSEANGGLSIGFAAYYCLYTYIRKSEIEDWVKIHQIERLLLPDHYTCIYSTYSLSKEIEATYHRLKGGLESDSKEINESIDISNNLLEYESMKNNAAVIATYCDCIIWQLEQKTATEEHPEITKELMDNYNKALTHIKHATELVPDYHTYFRIYGQLLQHKQNIYPDMKSEEKLRELSESKKQFKKARLLVDREGFDYVKRINDIYLLETQSSIMMTEITAHAAAEISGNDISEKLERKIYPRMIELLGLFTAIIALVITTVQNITSTQSTFASLKGETVLDVLPILYENSVNLTVLFGLVILILFGVLLVGVKVNSGKLSKERRWEKWSTLILLGIMILAIVLLIVVDVIFKNNLFMF